MYFTGCDYAKGEAPYQDFSFLFDLRNELVHAHEHAVGVTEAEWKAAHNFLGGLCAPRNNEPLGPSGKIWGGLEPRGLVKIPEEVEESAHLCHWVDFLMSPETERWACKTTSAIIHSFIGVLPDNDYKQFFVEFLFDGFGPPA